MLVLRPRVFSMPMWRITAICARIPAVGRGRVRLTNLGSATTSLNLCSLGFTAGFRASSSRHHPTNFRLRLPDGLSIAAKVWGKRGRPILALHGWLDNANTFHFLGRELAAKGFLVVAIDWPGHGHSSHRSKDATYSVTDLPWYALLAVRALGWKHGFALLGHSMGAGASTMLAASCYPSKDIVTALCCIEVLGPLSAPSGNTAQHLAKSLQDRERYIQRASGGSGEETRKIYTSFGSCVEARLQSLKALPGDQRLTLDAATYLVERGTEEIAPDRWCFLHDPRLRTRSARYYTEEQILALLRSIHAPTLIVEADPEAGHAWPRLATYWNARLEAVKQQQRLILPGGHHLHLDPDTAPAVCAAVVRFYEEQAALQADWQNVSLELALSAGMELS